jgi:lysophospholipase L1-like esterase
MGRVSTCKGVIRTILLALLVVCAPALAWADPTQAEAKTDPVWTKWHAIYVANAQTKGGDVIFLGDSITQFWPHNGTQSWAELSSAFRAVNLGMSGDQVQNILWRIRNGELPAATVTPQPRAIVLLAGTNNVTDVSQPMEAIFEGYSAIVGALRARFPDAAVLTLALLPRRDGWRPGIGTRLVALNAKIETLADGQHVRYVDLRHLFVESGRFRQERMRDGLHPNEAGYAAMAGELEPLLASILDNGAGPAKLKPDADPGIARARAAWDALVTHYAIPGEPGRYFDDLKPSAGEAAAGEAGGRKLVPPGLRASVWTQSEIAHAALNLARVVSDPSVTAAAESALARLADYRLRKNGTLGYAATSNPGPRSERFWDDNGWLGLTFLQAAAQLKPSQQYLDLALEIFPFLEAGQDKNGGVYWKEDDPEPKLGIPATGSDDQVALRLHIATGPLERQSLYRSFAERNEDWVMQHLLLPNGMFAGAWLINEAQNPGGHGHVREWIFTYNQGLAIGADVLRFRITGNRTFLDRASATARAALQVFNTDKLWTQPPPFNAVFFRNLLVLDHFAPDPRYRQALESYLDRAWKVARDPDTGLFRNGGIGMMGGKNHVFAALDQAAFVQMFALILWQPGWLPDAT